MKTYKLEDSGHERSKYSSLVFLFPAFLLSNEALKLVNLFTNAFTRESLKESFN